MPAPAKREIVPSPMATKTMPMAPMETMMQRHTASETGSTLRALMSDMPVPDRYEMALKRASKYDA